MRGHDGAKRLLQLSYPTGGSSVLAIAGMMTTTRLALTSTYGTDASVKGISSVLAAPVRRSSMRSPVIRKSQ